ncbi:hypothetical protein EC968_003462 [Mortierella alpina]|nr:hypothetical protein EC968_003462 [Mortierella alpina]
MKIYASIEETQAFRLLEGVEIEEILCDQLDGQNIIYWEDIEQAFPGVEKVKNGRVIVSLMRDANRTRITPHCIRQYPGVVLDVLVSSVANHVSEDPPMATPKLHPAKNRARSPTDPSVNSLINPPAYTPPTNLPADLPTTTPASIQHQTLASLGKPSQFYELPLPRLPIVLPMTVRRVGELVKPLPQHFKLYLLCECGAHTTREGSMETDRIHLADHAGYDILRPMELFEQFGTYILAVMKAFRAEIPSMIIAPLASPTVLQEFRRVEAYTNEFIGSLVDMTIDYLEGLEKGHGAPDLEGMRNPFVLENEKPLFGYTWPLSLFVDIKDRTPGNLYRSVNKDGSVYWICRAHSQLDSAEVASKQLREFIDENEGSFEDETGTVEIKLTDESKAIAFCEVLGQAHQIQKLEIFLTWNASKDILQSLADAALKSDVFSMVFKDVHNKHSSVNDRNTHKRTTSQPSLQRLRIEMLNQNVTAMRSEDGKMLVSTTSSKSEFLRLLLDRFGWAMENVYIYFVCADGQFDLRPWVQSIEDHGGVSNLRSLSLDESQLAPESRPFLLEIIERSKGLKTLELSLTRLNENRFTNDVRWYLTNLGSRVTKLNLSLREGKVHLKIAVLLSRSQLPRLTDIRVFNEGQNDSSIRWLINLVSADARSKSRRIQASDLDAKALTHLYLDKIYAQDDTWGILIEALEFESLINVDLSNCSIRPPQWTQLINRLPKDGLLKDGNPVPLLYLNVRYTPLEQAFKGKKETLKAELAERAPFAELYV